KPPPLAILGGNTTDVAIDQARQLRKVADALPKKLRPLLLLTTATADKVPEKGPEDRGAGGKGELVSVTPEDVPLLEIYETRTFRCCLSNRQVGAAVMGFIWSRHELRPDTSPVYPVLWQDDAYSSDLSLGFAEGLEPFRARTSFQAAASDWGAVAGFAGLGGF